MKKDDEFFVMVVYNTNSESTAFSWMTKEQTACKTMEYLFTQCEDIACRSVAPMQDTPANRITYEAKVTVPNGFVVKMSANETNMEVVGNKTTFYFENKIAMPSYLIAMAIGDLEYRSLGERTGVITEPCRIDAVADELVELPDFLDKAEAYLTPYIWGNYTILILPPSFPMGGMENPLLTFASPTIITGDKSQVDVAIHEIAHSWTGNEITCENWSNFWLNEGFTVFEERKVSAQLHDEDFSKVNAFIGNISATSDMLGYGIGNNYSSLYPLVENNFPDDSFSTVPYEKGFQLLYYMETELLGADNMQKLLRQYITKFSLTSVNYMDFKGEFEAFVDATYEAAEATTIKGKMDWETWVKSPGLAPVFLDFTTPALNESSDLADQYITLAGASSPSNFEDFKGWYSSLQVIMLTQLNTRKEDVNPTIMAKIDADLNVTNTLDPECKNVWFQLGIRAGYEVVVEPAHTFISSMGRMKYLKPIYQALMDTNQLDLAKKWYQENVNFYHPYAVAALYKMLYGGDMATQMIQ